MGRVTFRFQHRMKKKQEYNSNSYKENHLLRAITMLKDEKTDSEKSLGNCVRWK